MAQFTIRVELHDANLDEYEILHEAMETNGFSRVIASSEGDLYHLPWAEYDRQGSLTKAQVLKSARAAAEVTGKKYGILVTESSGRTWYGLEKA
jgi:hypothetical protein